MQDSVCSQLRVSLWNRAHFHFSTASRSENAFPTPQVAIPFRGPFTAKQRGFVADGLAYNWTLHARHFADSSRNRP